MRTEATEASAELSPSTWAAARWFRWFPVPVVPVVPGPWAMVECSAELGEDALDLLGAEIMAEHLGHALDLGAKPGHRR